MPFIELTPEEREELEALATWSERGTEYRASRLHTFSPSKGRAPRFAASDCSGPSRATGSRTAGARTNGRPRTTP